MAKGDVQERQHQLTGQRTPNSGYWPTSEPNPGDHDFPLTGSNFGNLTAFRAIFSHIFTAHAQERPLMNFQLKF